MASKKLELGLGMEVIDVTTGFRGIATSKVEQLNGNTQYGVQPACVPDESGRYPDCIAIDQHVLDVVGKGQSDRVTEVTATTDVIIGNTVEDIVTGMIGTAIEKITYMNGCVAFFVIGKVDPKKPETTNALVSQLPIQRVKKVNDGIAKTITPPIKAASGKPPGGPIQRMTANKISR